MKCTKCGNTDIRYFGINKGIHYCRKCISFRGDDAKPFEVNSCKQIVKPMIKYGLSKEQVEISNKVVEAFRKGKNTLLHAVCGAGKTELVYDVIAYCINNQLQVGFCIPRTDVVIELQPRISGAFPTCTVTSVYGGHTSILEGDIILLTCHQLFRYHNYFDLLIIDETDAFPFYGDETLNAFFDNAIRGNYIMMSATPMKEMIRRIQSEGGEYLKLMKRYHKHPLIVPKTIISSYLTFFVLLKYMKKYTNLKQPFFVFTPSIEEGEKIIKLVRIFVKNGEFVCSKSQKRKEIIEDFKQGKLDYLVTTSILERGVTVKNLQVIVYNADNILFDEKTLIQIAGRVGRKIDAWDGEVIYIANFNSNAMISSIQKIKESNEYANL